jgi:hypothetical protein
LVLALEIIDFDVDGGIHVVCGVFALQKTPFSSSQVTFYTLRRWEYRPQ